MDAATDQATPQATPRNRLAKSQRAKIDEAERKLEANKLIAGLGREPTPAESLLITEATALVVSIRAARRAGKSTDDKTRLLVRTITKLGLKLGAAARPAARSPTLLERAAAQAAAQGSRAVAKIVGSGNPAA
jgi:hypothetical protein